MNFFSVVGRMCFALVFIIPGIIKILNWNESEQQLIHGMLNVLQNVQGMQWSQDLLDFLLPHSSEVLLVGTAMELLGGILIFLGVGVRIGALIVALFLIPTILLFHHFWWLEGADRELNFTLFLKNLSIFGASLVFFALGTKPAKKKPKESD
ncbi:MAG TPA: DoxX family protein [Rhabdochlamydiaceae bacterium]|nr:DoxX family protein [Rhabdochlamydiaceae bacterium]